jgi:hypothetical protein
MRQRRLPTWVNVILGLTMLAGWFGWVYIDDADVGFIASMVMIFVPLTIFVTLYGGATKPVAERKRRQNLYTSVGIAAIFAIAGAAWIAAVSLLGVWLLGMAPLMAGIAAAWWRSPAKVRRVESAR